MKVDTGASSYTQQITQFQKPENNEQVTQSNTLAEDIVSISLTSESTGTVSTQGHGGSVPPTQPPPTPG